MKNGWYEELLLDYFLLRTHNQERRIKLWWQAADPFYFATPVWQREKYAAKNYN